PGSRRTARAQRGTAYGRDSRSRRSSVARTGPSASRQPSARSAMLMTAKPQEQPAGGQHAGNVEQYERRLDQQRVAARRAAAEAEQQKTLQRPRGAPRIGSIERGGESGRR